MLLALIGGMLTARLPSWVATFLPGAPAVGLALARRTRFSALVSILCLAPFMPYLKALTGVRYGPLALDAALAVLLLGWVLDQLAAHKPIAMSRADILAIAFILLGAVQLFNPSGPGLAPALEGYRMLVWQAVGFLVGRRLIESPEQLRTLLGALRLSMTLVALYAIKQVLSPSIFDQRIVLSTVGDPSTYTSLGTFRAFSTMSSPFHLAYFMVQALLLHISLLEVTQSKTLVVPQMLVSSVALLLSIVRTGWVGLVIGLVAAVAISSPRGKRVVYIAARFVACLAAASGLFFVLTRYLPQASITERMLSLTNIAEDRNYRLRQSGWQETILPAIRANPLGYGTGSDTTASSAQFYSHNGFLYVAIELGIAGLLVVIVLLVVALAQAQRSRAQLQDPFLRAVATWALSSWIALLGMATVGGFLEVYPVTLYAWFMLGVATIMPRLDFPRASRSLPIGPEGAPCTTS